MSFEKSISKVDEIIKQLDSGDIPLEKAIELYKEGVSEISACKKELESAALKISYAEDLD